MGPRRRRGSRDLSRVVRVVPDVPSFAVDDGFAYAVPDGMAAPIGALVRVPLGGRRVRGWVVAEHEGDPSGLKAVLARSGDLEIFDRRLLQVMRWAAIRYVAPLSAVLAKATPPNLPRLRSAGARSGLDTPSEGASSGSGRRPSTECWVGRGPWADEIAGSVRPDLAEGRNTLVVAATVIEANELAALLRASLGPSVVSSGDTAAERTAAWTRLASVPGSLVVATRGSALWPIRASGRAFVIGEARRGMKDKAMPTTHARDLLVKRSQVQRLGLVMTALVPSAEALALATPRRVPSGRRLWGLVEVVDRRLEDAGGHLLGPRARSALRAAVGAGRRVLLFTHRRTTAQRCVACRVLRRCEHCGSGAFDEGRCVRCHQASDACGDCGFSRFELLGAGVARVRAEAARVVGRDAVGEAVDGAPVVVGTERDLPGLTVDLTVIVDADGPILAPTYRAGEDALRLLGRAVAAAGLGRGRRGLVQTADPDHPVIEALRRSEPVPCVAADSRARSAAGFPPGGEILILEVDAAPHRAHEDLIEVVGDRAQVLGPADHHDRTRWLLQGVDLTAARVAVRSVVARWRDGGARVRVDADPIDL